jgi:hypothetical protein
MFKHCVLVAKHVPGLPALVSQHPLFWHLGPVVQHAFPAAPQGGTHVPLVHVPLFEQVPLLATHFPFVSQQPPFAQTLPGQHVCVAPPHVWQVPLTHVSPAVEHGIPFPTHVLFAPGSQHPPPLHVLPAQQASSAAPHV